ncbi:uncharacterized protein [Littorina saxatilis]|uniref:Uncharacterized protein n=1 Tax=Littorina saxatilis TaxID=31220 RepID=A0AAN9BRK0_9CAEN
MNPLRALLFLAAVIASTYGHCYDAQVASDQYYDDSFVCTTPLSYPAELIESDLNNLQNLEVLYFLDTATSCFNETDYFTNRYASPGEYIYQCVCPSPRKRIEAVYLNKEICHVVYPERQDIQYAQCGGHCTFDYATKIATASRGYFCAYQSYVQREFMVWCPNVPLDVLAAGGSHASGSGGHLAHARAAAGGAQVYQPFGSFHRVSKALPTLCSCRGYFCDNHNALIH